MMPGNGGARQSSRSTANDPKSSGQPSGEEEGRQQSIGNGHPTDDESGTSEIESDSAQLPDDEPIRLARDGVQHKHHGHHHRHHHRHHPHHHHRHHHHHHHNSPGRVKEIIKPDPTVRAQRARASVVQVAQSPCSSSLNGGGRPSSTNSLVQGKVATAARPVATVVDEEQLHRRFLQSISLRKAKARGGQVKGTSEQHDTSPSDPPVSDSQIRKRSRRTLISSRSSKSSSGSSSVSSSERSPDNENERARSPPPAAIIIPPSVAESMSARSTSQNQADSSAGTPTRQSITREQLEYGPLLKPGEVQVLYRSPDTGLTGLDRHLKSEQAKLVAPGVRQSPIAIMTLNPTYELQNKPLILEYPATVENLRLNNTGFSWEVKIPYQISMTTALYGAHLNTAYRYRLDQFHCHWGASNDQGSEHTVDNKSYSAEVHFVHYNMEKYRTLSKAARHPDGLVVLSVFLEANEDQRNHAELEKVVAHLKSVPLKGEHSIIKQAVRIENLLPVNKSYWSYQGSLTTPPYFESVTWFVFKHPIKCNTTQIQKFRNLKSTLNHQEATFIKSNHRKAQPLNGRTIVSYDEPSSLLSRVHHQY